MRLALIFSLTVIAQAAMADPFLDSLDTARNAYEAGKVQEALTELGIATSLLKTQRARDLVDLLPEPEQGWTRTINEEAGAAMGALGGTGMVAEFSNGTDTFSVRIMADLPMMAGMANVFSDPQTMATMGDIERVGSEVFLKQPGGMTAFVDRRIMVQASGSNSSAILEHLKRINYAALKAFGIE